MAMLCEYCVQTVHETEERHKHGRGVLCADCYNALPTGLKYSPDEEEVDEIGEHTCDRCGDTFSTRFEMSVCEPCGAEHVCDACITTCHDCGTQVCKSMCSVYDGDVAVCISCNDEDAECGEEESSDDISRGGGIFHFVL